MIKTTPDWDWKDYTYNWVMETQMARQMCSSDDLLLLEKFRLDPKTVKVQFTLMVFHESEPKESIAFEQRTDCAYPLAAKKNLTLRRKILLGFKKLRG